MKLQFSLATLLVCMTVLAVVCALCIVIPVHELSPATGWDVAGGKMTNATMSIDETSFRPTASEVQWRLAIWGPLAIVATLAGFWIVHRLKSQPRN